MMTCSQAVIYSVFSGWLYQLNAPCNWRISQWMPMLVLLNLEAVSKCAYNKPAVTHTPWVTAFNNAGKGTVQMLDVSNLGTSSTCTLKVFLNLTKNTWGHSLERYHIVLTRHLFHWVYLGCGYGDGCICVCLTTCVPLVQSYCCGGAMQWITMQTVTHSSRLSY